MNRYYEIRCKRDIKLFEEATNCLHDGYITSVEYHNSGIDARDGYTDFDYKKTSLAIRILVTSLGEKPTVELRFENIVDWQIISPHNEVLNSVFSFGKNGIIVWADADDVDEQIICDSTFAAAKQIFWRIM